MWACARVETALVTFSHRGHSDRHYSQLRLSAILRHWLGILYLKVYSLFLVCVLRHTSLPWGKEMCNVILLLAWLEKIHDVIWDSRCESQSGRCNSPAFWIWELAAQGAYNQTWYLLKCSCYDLLWRKGSRGDRSRSTVFRVFFTKDKFGSRLTEKLCLSQFPVSSWLKE